MKKYLLLITLALVVAPLVAAGCVSPTSPSPSPSKVSTATSAATNASEAREYANKTETTTAGARENATTAASQQATVTIPNTSPPYSFQPSTMTVARGASVTWRNDATVPHQIVSNTGAFSGPVISPGQTYTHQFTQAGTYPYHCAIHPYMMGTITVQ